MLNKSVFSVVNLAVNMALPVFAAERRAAAPLLLNAGRVTIDRYFLTDGPQQQPRRPLRSNDWTNEQTLYRYKDPGPTC